MYIKRVVSQKIILTPEEYNSILAAKSAFLALYHLAPEGGDVETMAHEIVENIGDIQNLIEQNSVGYIINCYNEEYEED